MYFLAVPSASERLMHQLAFPDEISKIYIKREDQILIVLFCKSILKAGAFWILLHKNALLLNQFLLAMQFKVLKYNY